MKKTHLLKVIALTAIVSFNLSGCDRIKELLSDEISPVKQQQIEKIIHEYIVKNPQVLLEASKSLQQQRLDELQKKALAMVPLHANQLFRDAASPIAGNPNGSVVLVEFFDYQCPHCKTMTSVIAKLIQSNPQLKVVFKQLPIFGGSSEVAAKAALAAQQQGKFLLLHEALMGIAQPLNDDEIFKAAQRVGLNIVKLKQDMQSKETFFEIRNTFVLAEEMGIAGTPAFFIATDTNQPDPKKIKAYFLPGSTGLEELQKIMNQLQKS